MQLPSLSVMPYFPSNFTTVLHDDKSNENASS